MKTLVLTYHDIVQDSALLNIKSKYELTYILGESCFEKHMHYLKNNNFSIVSFDKLLSNKLINKEYVIITFDDGLLSNFTNAFPILNKYNYMGTFFLPTKFIGQDGYLNWEQIKWMSDKGMSFHSHAHSHIDLTSLTYSGLKEELVVSKRIIEDKLLKPVDILSIPLGRYNQKILDAAIEVEYKIICTSDHGYNINSRNNIINRISIKNQYSFKIFQKLLEFKNSIFVMYKIRKKLLYLLKKLIGYSNYSIIRDKLISYNNND